MEAASSISTIVSLLQSTPLYHLGQNKIEFLVVSSYHVKITVPLFTLLLQYGLPDSYFRDYKILLADG